MQVKQKKGSMFKPWLPKAKQDEANSCLHEVKQKLHEANSRLQEAKQDLHEANCCL